MKNFVIDYHGGSGGDFLRVCLWLMLHPEYKDVTFDVVDDNKTMVRIVDYNDLCRHVCSIDKTGKVSPGIFKSDVLFDPIRDALRYHCKMSNAPSYSLAPIQQSLLSSNTREEFKIHYKKQIEDEIEKQAQRDWETRDPESDCNISIGHDIFWAEGNNHILDIRNEILTDLLKGPVHQIGLLADTPLATAIMLILSYKKDVLSHDTYQLDNLGHMRNVKVRMATHKSYKISANNNTTVLSVTDLLNKDLLFKKLNNKISTISKTEVYEKFYNKYMFINKMDEVVQQAQEYKKHFE